MSENVGGAFYAFVDGKGSLVKAFDILSKEVIAGVKAVTERNAQAVVRNAKARVHVSDKAHVHLRDTIRYEIIVDSPTAVIAAVMAGYGTLKRGPSTGKRLRFRPGRGPVLKDNTQPGVYAAVVEFGSGYTTHTDATSGTKTTTSNGKNVRQAHPFLFPAARIQRSTYVSELTEMLSGATRKAGAV